MRPLVFLLIGTVPFSGCGTTKGMKVDNPVVPPPPPRITRANDSGSGPRSESLIITRDRKAPVEDVVTASANDVDVKPGRVSLNQEDAGNEFADAQPQLEQPADDATTELKLVPEKRDYADGMVVATVNDNPIFAGELLEPHRARLEEARGQFPPDKPELFDEWSIKVKEMLVKRYLADAIERKMLVTALKGTLKEAQQKALKKYLDEEWGQELRKMMDKADVTSIVELEAKLQEQGLQLSQLKLAFCDQQMARQYMALKGQSKYEPSRDDLLAYYKEHAAEYDFPAEAKWRQIMISDKVHGGKEKAKQVLEQAIAELLDGADFAEIASKYSDGPTAKKGGLRDWMLVDSLKNKDVKQALLETKIGEFSPYVRVENGSTSPDNSFQIIFVVDRTDAGRTPFQDVQADIKKKLQQAETMRLARAAIDKLKEDAVIVTIFDGEQKPAAQSANEAAPLR